MKLRFAFMKIRAGHFRVTQIILFATVFSLPEEGLLEMDNKTRFVRLIMSNPFTYELWET